MSVYDERINRLRQAMKEKHIDYYLIPTADDHASEYVGDYYKVRNYYAGFTGSAGTLVIGLAFAGLWTDGRYFIQAEEQLKGSGVRLFPMGKEGVPTVEDYIREHMPKGGVLAYDGRVVDSAWGARMEKLLAKKQAIIRWEDDLAGQLWTKRPAPASRPGRTSEPPSTLEPGVCCWHPAWSSQGIPRPPSGTSSNSYDASASQTLYIQHQFSTIILVCVAHLDSSSATSLTLLSRIPHVELR